MGIKRITVVVEIACSILLATGCATWSSSSVDSSNADQRVAEAIATKKTLPSQVTISDSDVVDRRYASLGDISVSVNKTTVFHADPTREMVNEKLRDKAAEMGADAVLLVRYGNGGVSLMSWGSLEGKGRAVKFLQ